MNTTSLTTFPLSLEDQELIALSKERQLSFNLKELEAIRAYFFDSKIQERRKSCGLPNDPTDVEIEMIAQTWSEHCKHKIFNSRITYREGDKITHIDSLFNTYIKRATEEIRQKGDWILSAFDDNAGVFKLNERYGVACKVETHNTPSAIDPYQGALTGILGVNRDILGVGKGARPIANIDVLCFPTLQSTTDLPPGILPPAKIFEGVCRGIKDAGNKSGIPTVNGAILFDQGYLAKPLVYCGTLGIMPLEIGQESTISKAILPGDRIVVVGGKTGRDGVHGATCSSTALDEHVPQHCVPIGNPYVQKKLTDFLLEARDQGLYRTLTDNGAGGLSSSAGELALLTGGCELSLEKVPLKFSSLLPWEILVSESQERMTFAVPPDNVEEFCRLAAFYEVDAADIGQFTNSGYFQALFEGQTLGLIDLTFLHKGNPQLELEAEWQPVTFTPLHETSSTNFVEDLHRLLARDNICSKEEVVRQYDHEVQGATMLKPFVGVRCEGPSDAAILQPLELLSDGFQEGIVLGNGICPRFSCFDTYLMAQNAVDEAIRNCVAVGCNPEKIVILDNFCWPDPIFDSENNQDGRLKLAQLVRANRGLYDSARAYSTPIISGKDSMKNNYSRGKIKLSIPPTLLITAVGIIDKVSSAVTMDFKNPGDLIYIIGITKAELGGSEYALCKGLSEGRPPHVDCSQANKIFKALHHAIQKGLISSCHDCSEGGFAVALAEKAIASNYGAAVKLDCLVSDGDLPIQTRLFSESASRFVVTLPENHRKNFEEIFNEVPHAHIGEVIGDPILSITEHGRGIIKEYTGNLRISWKSFPFIRRSGIYKENDFCYE